ncbi:MAG: hypothetical protein H6704_03340 [Myxococcales bacterium]|nr:hypothetical protein [Myxococcales bacterium]
MRSVGGKGVVWGVAAALAGCGGAARPAPPVTQAVEPVFAGCRAAHRDPETLDVGCPTFLLSIRRAPPTLSHDAVFTVVQANLGAERATVAPYTLTIDGRTFEGQRWITAEPARQGFLIRGDVDEAGVLLIACFNGPEQPTAGLAARCSEAITTALRDGLPRAVFEASPDG